MRPLTLAERAKLDRIRRGDGAWSPLDQRPNPRDVTDRPPLLQRVLEAVIVLTIAGGVSLFLLAAL